MEAVIQVQKGAPASLLVGTDVLPQLGYLFVQSTMEGEDTDLLGSGHGSQPNQGIKNISDAQVNKEHCDQPKENCNGSEIAGTVQLIQATKLPARHKKMVRTQIFNVTYGGCNCVLFEPNIDELEGRCLLAPETFTSVDDNNGIVLVLENHGCEPVYLEAGQVLGWVCNAVVCPGWENSVDCIDSGVKNGSIMTVPMSSVNTLIMGAVVNKGEEKQQTLEGDPRVLNLLNRLMIRESNLTKEQLILLRSLVTEYSDIFALDMSELGVTDIVSHTVDTGSSPPIRQQVRRTPFALREKMEELIQDMMAQGVIKQSSSPWARPVVLVEKRDGSHRFCVDYRRLNAVTKMDVFPLPRVDDTLEMLSRTQYFSTLDLTAGYWQVQMDKDSQLLVLIPGIMNFR